MKSKIVPANGIDLHVVEVGEGPPVVLCHGFPETWRSWRRQMVALAAAGYRAIAPDLRGYGRSTAPVEPDAYTQLHIVGDLIGLLDALELSEATIIGHDWGAAAAWSAALMRPDRFPRVVALSIPYVPRGDVDLLAQFRGGAEHFYMLQFQALEADDVFGRDASATLRGAYHALSGAAADEIRWDPFAPPGTPLPSPPAAMPAWLDPEDLMGAIASFEETGFHGGLNWYRAIPLTWALTAPYQAAKILQPSLFIIGEKDTSFGFSRGFVDALSENAPGLMGSVVIPGAGHWVQQEAADAVSAAILRFLSDTQEHGSHIDAAPFRARLDQVAKVGEIP